MYSDDLTVAQREVDLGGMTSGQLGEEGGLIYKGCELVHGVPPRILD